MTGRRPLDDAELIERLGALSTEIAWPATPDVASRVKTAIVTGQGARGVGTLARLRQVFGGDVVPGGRRIARRSLVIAIVALLAIVVAAAAIGLGVPGIRIDLRQLPTPTPPSATSPGPSPSTAAASHAPTSPPTPPDQQLGPIVSLDQARSEAGFGLLVPAATGFADPTEVHINGVQPFTRVALWYGPQATLLTEFVGEIQPDAFQKIVGGGTTVEPVKVGQGDAWWIAGAPHELMLSIRDPDGQTRWQQVMVNGNVLVWQAGSLTLRLETPRDLAGAMEIATSLR